MQSIGVRPWGRFLALALAAVLLASMASESAFGRSSGRSAHSGSRSSHGHAANRHYYGHRAAVGVIVAAPAFWYFPAPIYVPPVVAAPAVPPVYIERGDAQPASGQAAGEWWYYCADTQAYYPYVKECSVEWQRVAPQPSASR
jgi:hypothetical protein